MKEILINHFLDYEFVYIFLFCSLIFLSLSIFIKKEIIKKISIILFSTFFILFLFELFLSFFMAPFLFAPIEKISMNKKDITKYREILFSDENNNLHRCYSLDSKIEEESKIYKEKNYKVVYDKSCSLYHNGLRYTKSNIKGKDTYVFLGCSFTFGTYLNDDETLPYYFSELLNFKSNIINLGKGAKGSNFTISLLESNILENFVENKKNVTLFIYSLIQDHIYRNFRFGQIYKGGFDPWIKENNDWIIPKHKFVKIKLFFIRSYIFRKIFLQIIDEYNETYYKNYMIESIQKINTIVKQKYNSKLMIVVWPEMYGNDFVEKLKSMDIDLMFLPVYFNLEKEGYRLKDRHPTAKANKEIAEILYNHINNLDNKNREN